MCCRISREEKSTTEVPLCAMPNLWVSTDMEVTPGTEKSNAGICREGGEAGSNGDHMSRQARISRIRGSAGPGRGEVT